MEIKLRAPEKSDVDSIFRIENDCDIRNASWSPLPVSRQQIWSYVDSYAGDIYADGHLRLVIDVDGAVAGTIDITDLDPYNKRAMIGIAVSNDMRRLGIGKMSLAMAVDFCKEKIGLHQLAAIVNKSNLPSLKLFTSIGFKTAGCLRSWIRRGIEYDDAVVLQLLFR